MKIRDMVRDDYPAVALMLQEFEDHLAKLEPGAKKKKSRDLKSALQKIDFLDFGAFGLLAESQGQPVAYLLYCPMPSTEDLSRMFYIEDLFVRQPWRSKGVGKKLISAVIKRAQQRGVTGLVWTVFDRNPAALKFYLELGADTVRDEFIMTMKVPKTLRRVAKRTKTDSMRA